jgi:hypothetical protein
MGLSNKELIEKATITTDAIADAGKLNPEQADRFIDFVIDETSMKNMVRVVKFRGEQRLIEKINVANRVAVPAAEAADPNVRRGVTTSKVTLQPEEIMVPFELGDLLKDENIEGDDVEEHIIKMMATRFANNIEQLWWNGNAVGSAKLEEDLFEGGSGSLYIRDSYFALFNGWLELAEASNIVDAQGAVLSPNLFSRALNAMPNKFKKMKQLLKWIISWDHEQVYRETVSSRATSKGDDMLAAVGTVPAFGVMLIPVSLLDSEPEYVEDSVANSDGSTPTALSHAPITNLVLTTQTLGSSPEAAYVVGAGNDYTVDETNGTWTRLTGGNIGSGATVKASYQTGGRFMLTDPKNLIAAIGKEITLEKDRNIFKRVNEFALTAKVHCEIEETTAVVLVKNVAPPA